MNNHFASKMEVSVKRPTMLVKDLLADASRDLDLSVERDMQTIARRCEHESFSFLTITLPSLSDALEKGIECGTFTCPTHFSRHGRLPRLLGGFFKRVFNKDGALLDEPCPYSIRWIRQICRFFKKPKIGCDDTRNCVAIQHFVDVEGELRRMTSQVERKDIILDKLSGIIWSQVFPELDYLDLVCHHGPGVTADRYLSNERNRIRKWNHRSELTYPSDLHCFPNYGVAGRIGIQGASTGEAEGPEYLAIRDELPVRVVFVPKTLTAPRVIAIEPSHMQFMQQSLKDYVYRILESHSLTRNSIRFSDQTPNQRLAHSSSIDRRLATLDLKDASDRVHLHLVQRIFKTSGILEYLEDARSLHATLPNGKNMVLFKYASMGSALCFPVEAMVFYTLIQSAMHQLDGRRPSSRSVREYSRQIDIYGDDIIVPVEYADVVVNYLESYALKVNVSKSFKKGFFRESCGADFFKGIPVNPIYAREIPHDNLRRWGAKELMSWTATADALYLRGCWQTAQSIRDLLTRVVRRTIPKSRKLGSGLFFFSLLYSTGLRWNANLQNWKQKRIHFDPINRKDQIDGDELACLNKWGLYVSARQSGRQTGYTRLGVTLSSDHFRRFQHTLDSGGGFGESECRMGPKDPDIDAWIRDSGLCQLPVTPGDAQERNPVIPIVAGGSHGRSTVQLDVGGDGWLDFCLTDQIESDPLRHLSGDVSGLDFDTSTKRGCFKSKSRWVSLAG